MKATNKVKDVLICFLHSMTTDGGCERATYWAESLTGLGLVAGATGFPLAMRTRPVVSTLMTQMTLTHGRTQRKSFTPPVNQSQLILMPGEVCIKKSGWSVKLKGNRCCSSSITLSVYLAMNDISCFTYLPFCCVKTVDAVCVCVSVC